MENFCFAITCRNREQLYYNTLTSLHRMLPSANILIYDDASTTIDHRITLKHFPKARIFRSNAPSGRADYAIHRSMQLYLSQTDQKYVVLTDSDLIFDKSLPEVALDLADQTDGFWSFFNTANHTGVIADQIWLIKNSVGSAGSVFRRDVAESVLANVPVSNRYDWDWSNYLKFKNIRLLCTRRSYIQHLGFFEGQNSSLTSGDFGLNFEDYNSLHIGFLFEYVINAIRLDKT